MVALGNGSAPLCASLSVPCPVLPVKGHLVTVSSTTRHQKLEYNLPLTSRTFFAPLGNGTFRLSGFADVVPLSDNEPDDARVDALIDAVRPLLGEDFEVLDTDCGFRPVAADDLPLVGRTAVENVFLCTGGGTRGWTTGAGCGKLMADLILGGKGEIEAEVYSPRRFEWGFYFRDLVEGLKRRNSDH